MANVVTIPCAVQEPRRPGTPILFIIEHDPGQKCWPDGTPEPVSAEGVGRYNALPPAQRKGSVGGYQQIVDGGIWKIQASGLAKLKPGGRREAQQAEIERQRSLSPDEVFALATIVVGASDETKVNGAGSPDGYGVYANANGLHICLCDFSPAALEAAARIIAGWLTKFPTIPNVVWWSQTDWPRPGRRRHGAIPRPNTHTDTRNELAYRAELEARIARILNPAPPAEPVLEVPLTTVPSPQKPQSTFPRARPLIRSGDKGRVLLSGGATVPGDKPWEDPKLGGGPGCRSYWHPDAYYVDPETGKKELRQLVDIAPLPVGHDGFPVGFAEIRRDPDGTEHVYRTYWPKGA